MSDFIPEGVVADILSRLPTKSLIRFRSVSKLWNSLITSPNFINSHLNHSLTSKNSYDNLPLVIVRQCIAGSPPEKTRLERYKLFIDAGGLDNTFDEYLEIPFPLKSRRRHYYLLLGYVKGLFCVFEQDNFFFWNPSIRKSVCLPKPGITKKAHGSGGDYLGFGFDSRTNDYKVVRVVIVSGTKPSKVVEVPRVEVYSLNAGSWKVSSGAGDSFPPGFILENSLRSPSACLEGAIHWAAQGNWNGKERFVLSIDLSSEVFKTISMPNELASARFHIRTSVFRGLLSLVCDDNFDRTKKSCSIWMMKEYGIVDSWYKYVTVDLTGGIKGVIGIRNNGHILLEGDKPRPWELSSYDPRNKEIKKLRIDGTIGRFHVDTYEENLILLNKTYVPVSRMVGKRKRSDRKKATINVPERITNGGMYEHKELVDNNGSCFSPRSLFALPPDSSSLMLDSSLFMDKSSDQDLLLDVPSSNSFPQADLLFPFKFGAQASTSSAKGGIYEHKEYEHKELVDNDGPCFSPRSLFALPPDSSSLMLDCFLFIDKCSDQDLLLDVPSYNSFPQAELLFPFKFGAQASTSSGSSTTFARP